MAALSRNFAVLPEPIFLSPQIPTKVLKLSISRTHGFESRCNIKILGTRIWAVKKEEITVLDEREKELETKVNANANENGNGKFSYSNGSAGTYSNGSAKVGGLNGSLMKYVTGNGNGSAAAKTGVEVVKVDEVISGKKKTVEEIGQEDAWFKRKGKDQVEVSVAPGGQWNRFKTYSRFRGHWKYGDLFLALYSRWNDRRKKNLRGEKYWPSG